jgi:hypothetical protein
MADARTGERVLRIKFEPGRVDAARCYKLVWEDDDPKLDEFVHVSDYDIPKQAIHDAVAQVRPALQKFADGAKGAGAKEGTRILGAKKELALLTALATAGRGLFEALFKGANEEEQKYANEAREWYAKALKEGSLRIEIRSHPANKRDAKSRFDAIAPWGVVYPAEDVLPQGLELSATEIHDNFWALRHRITAFEPKHAGRPLSSTYDGVDLNKMVFRAYIHGDVNLEAEVRQHVSTSTEELDRDPAFLRPNANHLYYLNRRDPDLDAQTKGDRLQPEVVANLARRGIDDSEEHIGSGVLERAEQSLLGLIDGTAVLAEENAAEWYKAFFRHTWTAFIVVEVDTYDKPALDFFGLELFLQLGEIGGNMVDALDKVRRSDGIRPWGLLYSLFADPALVHLKNPPPEDFNAWIRDTAKTLQKRFTEKSGH